MDETPIQANSTLQQYVLALDVSSTMDGKSLSVALLSVGLFVLNIFSSTGAIVCGTLVGAEDGLSTSGVALDGAAIGDRTGDGFLVVGLFVATGVDVVGAFEGDIVGAAVGDNVVGAADDGVAVMGADVGK